MEHAIIIFIGAVIGNLIGNLIGTYLWNKFESGEKDEFGHKNTNHG